MPDDKTMRQLDLINDWCAKRKCLVIESRGEEVASVLVIHRSDKEKSVTASTVFDGMREWDRLYFRPENPDEWTAEVGERVGK